MKNVANYFLEKRLSHLKILLILIVVSVVVASGGYGVYARYFRSPLVDSMDIEAGTKQLHLKDFMRPDQTKMNLDAIRPLSNEESKELGTHAISFKVKNHIYKTNINVVDTTPPKIKGAADLKVEVGTSVAYKKDIQVTDNAAGDVTLTVDTSDVNLNKIGTYQVTYMAADASGNTAEKTVNLNVYKLTRSDIVHQRTIEKARRILAKITNESDSQAVKLKKAFMWIRKARYTHPRKFPGTFKSPLWPSIYADDIFDRHRGDCHSMSCAMAYMALVIGYQNVYLKQDRRRCGGGAHTWPIIEGKCYDPLFSVMKMYGWSKGWAVPERRTVYKAYRSRRITLEKILA